MDENYFDGCWIKPDSLRLVIKALHVISPDSQEVRLRELGPPPTNVEEEFDIKVWGIRVKLHRVIEFDSYLINPDVPDSNMKRNEKIVYDRDPELEKKLFIQSEHPNRLTKQEQDQIIGKMEEKFSSFDLYKNLIQSEAISRGAIKMELGQRAGRYFRFAQQLSDYVHYNRVEGLRLNYGFHVSNLLIKNSIISLTAGYGFKDQRWKAETAFLKYLTHKNKLFIEGNLYRTLGFAENRQRFATGKNSFTGLLYKGDYRDYYYKQGANIGLGYRATDQLAMKVSYVSQTESNAKNNTRFSLFKYKEAFRANPEIAEGEFRGFQSSIIFGTSSLFFKLAAEYTNSNWLLSDFSYSFIKADLRKSFRLTYHSHLRLSASGGLATGSVAPQRWFDFGGRSFLNYHGNLRAIDYKAFTGDKMALAVADYSINGGALYDRGLKLKLIIGLKFNFWSGAGWSSLSEKSKRMAAGLDVPNGTTDDLYYEFGAGLSDRFNIFRIDFARNSVSKNSVLVRYNFLQ
ncbi:MAG: DUF5686 family protein [Methanosarcinaceae archaeon]